MADMMRCTKCGKEKKTSDLYPCPESSGGCGVVLCYECTTDNSTFWSGTKGKDGYKRACPFCDKGLPKSKS